MADIASRRVNPALVRQILHYYRQFNSIRDEDRVCLTLLTLARGARKHTLDGPMKGEHCLQLGELVSMALFDASGHGRMVPAHVSFDFRQQAVRGLMIRFEEWCREASFWWDRDACGEPIPERWEVVLVLRGQVLDTISPLDRRQMRAAVRTALEDLGEPHGPAEIEEALLEAHHQRFHEKKDPDPSIHFRHGEPMLGWKQMRDALATTRGISRRRRKSLKQQPLIEEALEARAAQGLIDFVSDRVLVDEVHALLQSMLSAEPEGTNRWIVMRRFKDIHLGTVRLEDLAEEHGVSTGGLRKARRQVEGQLQTALRES